MKCIECGAETRVYETRDTMRRRKCTFGHRFQTFEVLVGKNPENPILSHLVHMIRTSGRMGKQPEEIAANMGLQIEVIQWYLKDAKPNKGPDMVAMDRLSRAAFNVI